MKLDSYWLDTAPICSFASEGLVEGHADVAVIGGGFTGLSAALALAKRGVSSFELADANFIRNSSDLGRQGWSHLAQLAKIMNTHPLGKTHRQRRQQGARPESPALQMIVLEQEHLGLVRVRSETAPRRKAAAGRVAPPRAAAPWAL